MRVTHRLRSLAAPLRHALSGRLMCGLPGVLLAAALGSATVSFPPYVSGSGSPTPVTYSGGQYADTSFEDVAYISAEFLGDPFSSAPRWETGRPGTPRRCRRRPRSR